MVAVSEQPEQYRTRSGRAVRAVPRYEPDEDTIFVDEESGDSQFSPDDCESDGDTESDLSYMSDASDASDATTHGSG